MKPIGSPEKSVSNHLTQCNNPKDRKFDIFALAGCYAA